jgi:hypothetical protein
LRTSLTNSPNGKWKNLPCPKWHRNSCQQYS